MKAGLRAGRRGALLALAALALTAPAQAQAQTIASYGSGPGKVWFPVGVAVDQSNGDLYVADRANFRIDRFDSEGRFELAWGWGVADGTSQELQSCGPAVLPEGTKRCFAAAREAGGNTATGPGAVTPGAVAVAREGEADLPLRRRRLQPPGQQVHLHRPPPLYGRPQRQPDQGRRRRPRRPIHPGRKEHLHRRGPQSGRASAAGARAARGPTSSPTRSRSRWWPAARTPAGSGSATATGWRRSNRAAARGPKWNRPGVGRRARWRIDGAGDFYTVRPGTNEEQMRRLRRDRRIRRVQLTSSAGLPAASCAQRRDGGDRAAQPGRRRRGVAGGGSKKRCRRRGAGMTSRCPRDLPR